MNAREVYNLSELKAEDFNHPEVVISKIINDLEKLNEQFKAKALPLNLFEQGSPSLDKRSLNILLPLLKNLSNAEKKPSESKEEKLKRSEIFGAQLINDFMQTMQRKELLACFEMSEDSEVIHILSQFFSCFPEYRKQLSAEIRDKFKLDFSWTRKFIPEKTLAQSENEFEIKKPSETKVDAAVVELSKKSIGDLMDMLEKEFQKCNENRGRFDITTFKYNENCQNIEKAICMKCSSVTMDDREQFFQKVTSYANGNYHQVAIDQTSVFEHGSFKALVKNIIKKNLPLFSLSQANQLYELSQRQREGMLYLSFFPGLNMAILKCNIIAWEEVVKKTVDAAVRCPWRHLDCETVDFFTPVIARADSSQLTILWGNLQKMDYERESVFYRLKLYALMIPRLQFSEVQALLSEDFFKQQELSILSLNPTTDKFKHLRYCSMEFILAALLKIPQNAEEMAWQTKIRARAIPLFLDYWTSCVKNFPSGDAIVPVLNKFLLSLPADDRISFFRDLLDRFEMLRSHADYWKLYVKPLFQDLEFREDQFDLIYAPEQYLSNNVFTLFPFPVQRLIAGYIAEENVVGECDAGVKNKN